jgi:hypothetical protein
MVISASTRRCYAARSVHRASSRRAVSSQIPGNQPKLLQRLQDLEALLAGHCEQPLLRSRSAGRTHQILDLRAIELDETMLFERLNQRNGLLGRDLPTEQRRYVLLQSLASGRAASRVLLKLGLLRITQN